MSLKALLSIAVVVVLFAALFPVVHLDGYVNVRVEGRLVESGSGEPLVSWLVISLPDQTWAEDEEWIAEVRQEARQRAGVDPKPEPWGKEDAPLYLESLLVSGDMTDRSGAFCIDVLMPVSDDTSLLGIRFRGARPRPAEVCRAVWVEAEAGSRMVLPVSAVSWRQSDDQSDVFVQIDIGTIEVTARGR